MSTYFTSMEFVVPRALVLEYLWKKKSLKKVKRRLVNWVDQEVTLHRAPFINDFRISLPLNATYSKRINTWIKFAMAKRVVNLELDFEYGTTCRDHLGGYSDQSYSHYLLPSNVFTRSSCRHLTSICFKFVDLREEVLELLLSRCHSLERLHIERSNTLSNMRIINLGRKLKYLAIHECFSLRKVEIHAVSLESFEFIDRDGRTNVVCASVPSLVEARFCWQHYGLGYSGLLPNFLRTYCFPAQLSKLSLDMKLIKGGDFPIPSFPNVKYLELRVLVDQHTNLRPLMCFAKGCPLMYDFKLQLIWPDCCCPKMKPKQEEHWLEIQEGTSRPFLAYANSNGLEHLVFMMI
ncbi:uncharacterized protein LOC110722045 [Chenopodium quinoa]|uniref:uncharacterized protein LOC110722045 n=1 Tax=Chenopodium quinoa TaxID=63459 RepID=UPI000B7771CF|nr:uncharacterized protein LOC110722045 [Chenopodium quinoa]